MSGTRWPRERLDALLSGLEDEVLRSEQTGAAPADEGDTVEDAGPLRSAIESLIRANSDGVEQLADSVRGKGAGPSGAVAKVAQALERLHSWAGVRAGERVARALPQVRMAFSGKGTEKRGGTVSGTEQRRRSGKDDGEDKDGR